MNNNLWLYTQGLFTAPRECIFQIQWSSKAQMRYGSLVTSTVSKKDIIILWQLFVSISEKKYGYVHPKIMRKGGVTNWKFWILNKDIFCFCLRACKTSTYLQRYFLNVDMVTVARDLMEWIKIFLLPTHG